MRLEVKLIYRVSYEVSDGLYDSETEAIEEEKAIFDDEILMLANQEIIPQVTVTVQPESRR